MARFPLLPRKKKTDKSRYGHVLVLAGSRGFSGAAVLAARAALAAGAGLVTLGVPEGLQAHIARRAIPEIMTLGLPSSKTLSFASRAASEALSFAEKRRVNCIVLGPGLSLGAQVFARAIVRRAAAPVVLDADGLNAFKGRSKELSAHASPVVLTPHAKEFERVFSKKVPEGDAARIALARRVAGEAGAVVVLKGHRTVVADRFRAETNRTGNPGMAKGGAGDVLSGFIGAFIAQGMPVWEAARWAVHYHGLAGDLAVRRKGELGLLASDIIEYLPPALRRA